MNVNHSVHDYRKLISHWRHFTKTNSLRLKEFSIHNDFPVYEISNGLLDQGLPSLYLSAGIHGDEPAPCWALLKWAKENAYAFEKIPVLIFPCLNPWGLLNNSRKDRDGNDLNRVWSKKVPPLVREILDRTRNLPFCLSLHLHEDFDANGIYLYEPYLGGLNDCWADKILSAGKEVLPLDTRKKIDGRKAHKGIIRPRINNPPSDGYPEALYFAKMRENRNFTLETPSEESFQDRILAHQCMIDKGVDLAFSNL